MPMRASRSTRPCAQPAAVRAARESLALDASAADGEDPADRAIHAALAALDAASAAVAATRAALDAALLAARSSGPRANVGEG